MGFLSLTESIDTARAGADMHALMTRLYPICRSITGEGIRETFRVLGETLPLEVTRVPTGTAAYDWTVPREWNVRDAFIKNSRGARVVDFARSSLHVVNYSTPVCARMRLAELKPHLHSLPDHPDWVPYRASYYRDDWGFCLTHRVLESLPDDEYEVVIDSSLGPGHLDYAECVLAGSRPEEVLVSTHACHPSMCNDNLSGVVVAATLATALKGRPLRHTYRFLFIPTIIGSIVWLSRNEEAAARVRHGLVLACIGDGGPFTYKRSRQGSALVDRAAAHVVAARAEGGRLLDFVPYGYDERNYCSPGFDLPVGVLSRTPHGRFPEYHTSADNLDFVRPEHLAASLEGCLEIVEILENDTVFRNLKPRCEPQLGRRGLYQTSGGLKDSQQAELAMFWILNLSDGRHSLLDVAERSGIRFHTVARVAERLQDAGLLAPAGG